MGTGLADAAQDDRKRDCRSAILNIFKNFDARGDGLYSRAELTSLLQALDTRERMSEPGIGDMLEALDTDRKGWIHYEVFCDFLFSPVSTTSFSLQEGCSQIDISNLEERLSRSSPDVLRSGNSSLFASLPADNLALTEPLTEPRTLPPSRVRSIEDMCDDLERTGFSTRSTTSFDESLPLPGSGVSSRPHSPNAAANLRAVLEIAAEGFIPHAEEPLTRKAVEEDVQGFFNEIGPEEFDQALSSGLLTCSEAQLGASQKTTLTLSRTDELSRSMHLRTWGSVAPWSSNEADNAAAFVSCAQDANSLYRSYMEDGQKVIDPLPLQGTLPGERWGYFAVYDGHGGREVVDYCEARLHEIVLAELDSFATSQNALKRDVTAALQESFRKIDAQLAMIGAWKTGCTATVALVHRRGTELTLHVANVGDSRAVVLGGSGPTRLTKDHKASDPDEAARIIQDGGMVRHGRVGGSLVVSRSLGDHALKECGVTCAPDVHSLESDTSSGSRALVIASDGLWDVVEDADAEKMVADCIERALNQNTDQQAVAACLQEAAASELVEEAKARGSRDNILVMVVFL